MSNRSALSAVVTDRAHPPPSGIDPQQNPAGHQGGSVMAHVPVPSRRWAVVALAVGSVILLAGCGSSSSYPEASPAVSSACQSLDKYFLNQTAPQSELNKVLKQATKSGDPVLERAARAYQVAASTINQSEKNEAFAKMVGRCQYYGIGPNQTP